jgi:hypothetical protein
LKLLVVSPSSSEIYRFPPPLPAAAAAGEWGNPGCRCVHNVGSGSSSAGGAVEKGARLEQLLEEVVFFPGDGAPMGFCSWSSASSSPVSPWSYWVSSPLSSDRVVVALGCHLFEEAADLSHGVQVDGARRRLFRVRGPATSRPLGGTSDPRLKGGGAAVRRRPITLGVDEDEIHKDLIVSLLSVLGLSVRYVA